MSETQFQQPWIPGEWVREQCPRCVARCSQCKWTASCCRDLGCGSTTGDFCAEGEALHGSTCHLCHGHGYVEVRRVVRSISIPGTFEQAVRELDAAAEGASKEVFRKIHAALDEMKKKGLL